MSSRHKELETKEREEVKGAEVNANDESFDMDYIADCLESSSDNE